VPTAAESRRIRVLLLLPDLSGGGAERIAVSLLNHIDRNHFDVRLGLLRAEGPYLSDTQPAHIELAADHDRMGWFQSAPADSLNAPTLRRSLMRLCRTPYTVLQLRALIRRVHPDIVLSFMTGFNIMTGLALRSSRHSHARWIAREGNNVIAVFRYTFSYRVLQSLARRFLRWSLRTADCTLAISQGLRDSLVGQIGVPPDKVRVIYNPTDIGRIRQRSMTALDIGVPGRFIIAIGRLEVQKGFDVLIRAAAECVV
jgi:glycosyltransferase involved in cell wall biosynthesis